MARNKFDPIELIRQVMDNDFDLTVFRQIDESHFPEAPNFLECTIGREFFNATILPWQVEANMHLFSEYCPSQANGTILGCSDPDYLHELFDEPLEEIRDHVQFLQHGVCPKCHKNKLELFTIGELHPSMPSLKSEAVICAGQRAGKTLRVNTQVMTPEGPVAIQNLKRGDMVYGYNLDGTVSPSKVLNVFDNGVQEITSLNYYNKEMFACTDTHRWLFERYISPSSRKKRGLKFQGTIQDMNKETVFSRVFVKIPGGTVREPHAYALGALAGDGCSRQGSKNAIWISSIDSAIPKKIQKILGSGSLVKNHKSNYNWIIYKENIICNHYATWLKGRYAHEKIIDLDVVRTWDRESRLNLLAGLIDTDGSLCLVKNKYGKPTSLQLNFCSQSRSLCDAFQYLFLSLFQVRLYEQVDRRDKYKNGPCFSLKLKSNFHLKRAWAELDPYLVSLSRKWKPEYDSFPIRNTNPNYINLKKGKRYQEQTYDIEVANETSLFVLAEQGVITHNSKDVVISSAYLVHRWCKLPDPIDYFSLPKMEIVLGTFSALSATQADENLWMPFRGLYDSAPWFQKYNEFLRGEQKRLSIPLVDVKDTYLYYLHKRLLLEFTGSDDRKKRGRTRLFGAIDEVAYLNTDKKAAKVMDADKNYAALNNSLATIRKKAMTRLKKFNDYNCIMPVMFNASSPKNVQDKIWTLTKSAPMNPWCHAIHRATWELNPDFTQEDCRNINQGISEIEFWRDFGAIPPYSDSPYLSDSASLLKLCGGEQSKNFEAVRDIFIDRMGDRYLMLRAKILRPDRVIPRMISLDNGYKNNAFAITVFRWDSGRRKPVLDYAINLQPEPNARLFINFPAIFDNFLIPLVKNFRITDVFFDRWQSLDQIQRLRNLKVEANAYSLHFEKDFMPFKQMMLSGGIGLPPCTVNIDTVKDMADPLGALQIDPVATLIWQCLTVREVGRKVMKPLDGDDDLFRAFVLGGSRFLDEKFKKKYEMYQSVLTGGNRLPIGRTYSFSQPAPIRTGSAIKSPYATSRTFGKKIR